MTADIALVSVVICMGIVTKDSLCELLLKRDQGGDQGGEEKRRRGLRAIGGEATDVRT